MSRERCEIHEFDAEDEARAFARKAEKDFWAYDAIVRTWQGVDDGKWKVSVNMRSSCD